MDDSSDGCAHAANRFHALWPHLLLPFTVASPTKSGLPETSASYTTKYRAITVSGSSRIGTCAYIAPVRTAWTHRSPASHRYAILPASPNAKRVPSTLETVRIDREFFGPASLEARKIHWS